MMSSLRRKLQGLHHYTPFFFLLMSVRAPGKLHDHTHRASNASTIESTASRGPD